MKTAILIIGLVLTVSNLLAQNSYELVFIENLNISDSNGNPINNESIYFPIVKVPYVKHYLNEDDNFRWINSEHLDLFTSEFGRERIKDSLFYHSIEPIHQRLYSKYLFELEEPILYNYFLGSEIVRLTYISALGYSAVIKMEKFADSTIMTLKKLDYQINLKLNNRAFDGNFDAMSISNNNADWIINEQFKIDNHAFYQLKELIDNLNIKKEVPFQNIIGGFDGFDLLFEIHTDSGYYYNRTWCPAETSSIYLISDYMIGLSGRHISEMNVK